MATDNAIAHHDEHRDDEGSRIGMWLFLVTELLLFGGMFFVFAVYKYVHYDAFHIASKELSALVGTINTVVLLTSSLTIALSIKAMEDGRTTLSLALQSTTLVFALVFLVNKYFEWSAKISHGTYPGSEEMMSRPNGEILFFGLYYVMTGLHALHVVVGLIIIAVMAVFTIRGSINQDRHVQLVNAGLYWHLVDVIWIFLFPLFYLIA